MSNSTQSKTEAKWKALAAGVGSAIPSSSSLMVDGQQYSQPQLVSKLQGLFDTAALVTAINAARREAVLGPWLKQRQLQRAGPEDFLFPDPGTRGFDRKEYVRRAWEAVANREERDHKPLSLSWYEATRHSFVSRSLTGGAGGH